MCAYIFSIGPFCMGSAAPFPVFLCSGSGGCDPAAVPGRRRPQREPEDGCVPRDGGGGQCPVWCGWAAALFCKWSHEGIHPNAATNNWAVRRRSVSTHPNLPPHTCLPVSMVLNRSTIHPLVEEVTQDEFEKGLPPWLQDLLGKDAQVCPLLLPFFCPVPYHTRILLGEPYPCLCCSTLTSVSGGQVCMTDL